MVKYSLAMKPKKDIAIYNAAVGRIKKAQKAGQTPSEADEDIVDNAEMGAYATLQTDGTLSIEDLCRHIVSHGSLYDYGDILAVLTKTVNCIREQLLEGKQISLGDLGVFRLRITQEPADTLAEYNAASNIKTLKAAWSPSAKLNGMKKDAQFELTTTRKTATAVIKAQKHGVGTVTI